MQQVGTTFSHVLPPMGCVETSARTFVLIPRQSLGFVVPVETQTRKLFVRVGARASAITNFSQLCQRVRQKK